MLSINAQTKIATLLKHHPDALEAIVSIAPDFKKLRNPILRKIMAGRTSISMASKIGKCTPDDFFKVLEPLGFVVEGDSNQFEEITERKPLPRELAQLQSSSFVRFDVREMLASGRDPLKEIQQKVKALLPEEVLVIIANFEPVPLIKLLEKQGFDSFVDTIDENTIETYFYRSAAKSTEEPFETSVQENDDWDQVLEKFTGNLVEIDVRHLEMPMPMMTILENLDQLEAGKALYVHHKRIPVFLLTELKDRKCDYRIKEIAEGEVYLLIFKD